MNKIIQISLIVLVTVILLLALPASAMIGGQLDTEHTNVGAIMMLWKEIEGVDDFIGRLCTATLIRPRALVTAAHCYPYFEAQGADPEQIWISFDQDPFAVDATYLGVEAFIPHPDFETDGHDIALIILKDPVPEGIGGEPVDLPDENYLSNVTEDLKGKDKRDIELKVVGYGATGLWSLPDLHLDAIRRFGTVAYKELLPQMIQTSSRGKDYVTMCYGDSGGPVFYVDQSGTETLVGLNSSSTTPCGDGLALKYRLDTASALGFINANRPPD